MMSLQRCIALSILLLVILTETGVFGADYYELLGVNRGATQHEIKKAYRNLAKIHHPDLQKTEEAKKTASEKYREVTTAYEVLSDEQKRRTYDQFGEEGLKQGGGGGHNPFGGFEDIFGFNFGGSGRKSGGESQKVGDSMTVELEVSLEDLYVGRTLTVTHKKQVLCPKCRGTGAENPNDVQTCPDCQGSGVKVTVQRLGPGFMTQTQTTCNRCGGKGRIIKSTCPSCKGKKVARGEEAVTIVIEKGMADGAEIVFEQEADEGPGIIPGNLVFKLVTTPNNKFVRKGHDLYYKGTISLLEALVGFSKHIKHLDGHTVTLARKEVTKPGLTMTIKGEGMPVHESPERGDLHVEFVVRFPKKISEEQKEAFKKLLSSEE